MARALRRKASSAAALALLACGGFAGAAFGDGLPIGSLTTSIIPTIGATTAISTPTASVTSVTVPPVSVPSVTVPSVTTPVTTTPAVTTPAVSTPTVAAPPVSVSATVLVPPSSTPVSATVSTPAASASVSAHASPSAPSASVHLQATAAVSAPGPSAPRSGGSLSGSASAVAPLASALPAASGSVAPRRSLSPAVLSARASLAGVRAAVVPSPSTPLPGTAPGSTIPRLVQLPAVASLDRVTPKAPELRPVAARPASSGPVWSVVTKNPGAAAGGIAALLVLAGLGIAGAARSPAFAAACAELSRFPFPRFRVLPCPDRGAPAGASGIAAGATASGAAASDGAQQRSPRPITGGTVPPLPPLPRIGGVLGAAVAKTPWTIVKGLVVAMLAAVNAVLLGIRWRVGRLQSR